jgi:regulator of cell morphogenesis and NO signaling
MYQTHKTFVKPGMKMSDLLNENHTLLLLLENLQIDFAVDDKTIAMLCRENNIQESVFVVICNLYNGFYPDKEEVNSITDIATIIKFLKNSHHYYKNDKYPEIKEYLKILHLKQNNEGIMLVEKFFNDYFGEVLEHLNYEDQIAFPYFCRLIGMQPLQQPSMFSVREYKDHHSDIETKLADLKNLLLKHIVFKNDLSIRRKFLYSLIELETDLKIHSTIEELILLPLIAKVEKNRMNG